MQHTLVAVFDNRADAQGAMDELLASGFSRSDVRMSGDSTTGMGAGTTATTTSADTDTGIGSSIKNFFSDLFSDDDDTTRASRYEGAMSSGKHVVTLTADSLPEVERAADIVERFGPIDIDEHSDNVGKMASSGALLSGSQSGMQSTSASAQSASTQQQGSLTGSSLQRDTAMETSRTGSTQSIPVVEEQLRVGKREVQRGGVRIYSGLDGTTARSDLRDDDSYYRNHFNTTYGATGGSYDDYAPAYSYGSQMASSGRYTGRQWDEVESDLRSDWDTRYGSGGQSTWEKMKAAVRHGWDRMTGDTPSGRSY